jgi:hypothetical protein
MTSFRLVITVIVAVFNALAVSALIAHAQPSAQRSTTSVAPVEMQRLGVREIRSAEFKHFDGRVRVNDGRVIFSHYDKTGNAHNIVAIDIVDGVPRNLAEGVRGGQFIAEDARYFVFSSDGSNARPLVVMDKLTNKRVATVRLQHEISWGHIARDRLLLLQKMGSSAHTATVLVYTLPGLKFERSVEITGGKDTALWGDKIVSIGYKLGIYDLDLREIAVVEMPEPDPNLRMNCGGGPLRIAGDRAVVGANCEKLAVVDLPNARIERIIPTASLFQSFAIAEGLLFTVDPDGKVPDVRVIELASGREFARLSVDAGFIAIHGKSLLAMMSKDFSTPVRFTLYDIDFESIRSETARIQRVVRGCRTVGQGIVQWDDTHNAIEMCEKSGIAAYVDTEDLTPDLREAVGTYARWLTLTLSRYAEGAAILERLQRVKAEPWIESQLAFAKRKASFLDLPNEKVGSSQHPEPQSVSSVSINFGASPDLMKFVGNRLYIARWACGRSEPHGVTLDVLDRKTLQLVKSIAIADCDDNQQDSITAVEVVPGYIVLGLVYRYDEAGRPTVAVVDERTLKVVKKTFVSQGIDGVSRWKGRLLACARPSHQPHHRFDPASARFVSVTDEESRACANGDATRIAGGEDAGTDSMPEAETPNYRVFSSKKWSLSKYRMTQKGTGAARRGRLPARDYQQALALSGRDELILQYRNAQRIRFVHYDIEKQTENLLFELFPQNRVVAAAVWERYLLVTMDRDLLVYDIERRAIVGYEKNLIREGFLSNCCGVDRNRIVKLIVDQQRLIALTFDGSNSRVVELQAYTSGLPRRDFFAELTRK